MTHLGKGVDGKDGQVGLGLGVVHEVKVDQFLQLQVVGLHAVHHVGKQGAAEGGGGGGGGAALDNGGLFPSVRKAK